MSRIGRLPITVPAGVTVKVDGETVSVNGPKGTLTMTVPPKTEVILSEGQVTLKAADSSLLGVARAIVANEIIGVTAGWKKVLELAGTGYRAAVSGKQLQLALGFSHPVNIDAPVGIDFEAKDNKITVYGADKAQVGQIAAKIRGLRPADPYKLKGFRYENEVIIKKAGKAAKAGGIAGGVK